MRIPKRVGERKNLPKFGDAIEGEANVTLQSKDYIQMEHPDDQLVENAEDAGMNTLASFILKRQERAMERAIDVDGLDDFDANEDADNGKQGDSEPATGGKYVPPGARGGARAASSSTADREAENTLRVSNLTKAVTEDDLRELFCRYGRVLRISLPKTEKKDDRGNIYKEPKGFAYVAFMNRFEAEEAMNALNGHGYDHLILKIEWAKAPDAASIANRGSGLGSGFSSGYGEKLAQDTKEKVSYASNLTENK